MWDGRPRPSDSRGANQRAKKRCRLLSPVAKRRLSRNCRPMKLFRLNRLFNGKSRRCFDVAIDHGFFNELGFLGGIEDLQKAAETLVGANPDAIQLTPGQAEVLQRIPGKGKPALVLGTDVATVSGRPWPRALFSGMIDQAVEQAILLDATCVVVNLFQIPEQPE